MDESVPDIKAWQAAYAAFKECVGSDPTMMVHRSMAWTAAMNAVLAFNREMNSRKSRKQESTS